jgi:hypothetical protein
METRDAPPPGYVLQSPDSTWWAERLQFEHWRTLDIPAKAELLTRWNAAVHQAHLSGLRELHSEASERELELRAAAGRYGSGLIRRLFGSDADR